MSIRDEYAIEIAAEEHRARLYRALGTPAALEIATKIDKLVVDMKLELASMPIPYPTEPCVDCGKVTACATCGGCVDCGGQARGYCGKLGPCPACKRTEECVVCPHGHTPVCHNCGPKHKDVASAVDLEYEAFVDQGIRAGEPCCVDKEWHKAEGVEHPEHISNLADMCHDNGCNDCRPEGYWDGKAGGVIRYDRRPNPQWRIVNGVTCPLHTPRRV